MNKNYLDSKNVIFELLSKEVGLIDIISILLGIAIGIIAGYFVRKNIYESKIGQANSEADRIIKQAEYPFRRFEPIFGRIWLIIKTKY